MTTKKMSATTPSERAELAKQIKALRQSAGMSKKLLAHEAQISRQTLDNIENGVTAPQAGVLERILNTLGVSTETISFESETDLWLTMIGTLIEQLPAELRPQSVDRVVRSLAHDIKNAPANVTPVHQDAVVTPLHASIDDFEEASDDEVTEALSMPFAALDRDGTINEQEASPDA